MPRLFTALEVPDTQRTALSLMQGGIPGARWIDPFDFHITLRFVGDVSPRTADDIVEALGRKNWPAPTIRLGELGAFGSKKPTSLYASVSLSEELKVLQKGQERLMQQLGLAPDARRFTPHVTIARCRSTKPDDVARYLGQRGGVFAPAFRASRFVLYSARDSVGGGPYRLEECWPLLQPHESPVSAALTNM